jgi:hypothetical protein
MQSNQKYVTAESIMARLAMKIRSKDFTIDEIVQWCAECTIEIINAPLAMYNYTKVKLIVQNHKALLPCNVYRLLDVFNYGNHRIKQYYNDGTHINFGFSQVYDNDTDGNQVIYINFLGIAVDTKTGYPFILRGHELACEAYCTKQLYREDFFQGKINQAVWREITDESSLQCAAANNGIRHHSNDDMRQMLLQVHNMIPRMKEIPMFHLDGIE